MNVYDNLKRAGVELVEPTEKAGIYERVIQFGANLVYVSGTGPSTPGRACKLGKIGADLTTEEGKEEARYCMINILSNLHAELGDLNRIKRFVKVLAFVSSSDDFYSQPEVANAASLLLKQVFGEEAGVPARSAVGVRVLPGNIPVEIELMLELNDGCENGL